MIKLVKNNKKKRKKPKHGESWPWSTGLEQLMHLSLFNFLFFMGWTACHPPLSFFRKKKACNALPTLPTFQQSKSQVIGVLHPKNLFSINFFFIQEHSLHLGKPIHDLGEPKNYTENLKKNEKKNFLSLNLPSQAKLKAKNT
jgi:hypothetical protein